MSLQHYDQLLVMICLVRNHMILGNTDSLIKTVENNFQEVS